MRLLYAPTSPFARKVRITAHELGLAGDIALVACPANRLVPSPEILAHNPLSQVPTLVLDDGTAIADSGVICAYLARRAGAESFLPPEGPAYWSMLTAHTIADGLIEAAQIIRFETTLRPAALAWPDWIEAHMAKIRSALAFIEAEMPTLGARVDLATVTYACALGYLDLRLAGFPWREQAPEAARWFAAFAERPSFVESAPQ